MRLAAVSAFLGLTVSAFAGVPVPRPSPEFAVVIPGGRQLLLSQFKGKVVALQFLFTTCPHCKHEAAILAKLNTEFGPKGFQPIGVAINPMGLMYVPEFVQETGSNFPVGYSDRSPALGYLGISEIERWVVPQLVLVDRKGVVRYQTPALGAEEVQNEAWLRGKIEELLKEPAGSAHQSKSTVKTARTAAHGPAD